MPYASYLPRQHVSASLRARRSAATLAGVAGTDADLELPPGVTRLVALGDPHGDLRALEGVLAREPAPPAAFLSMGDNVGYEDGRASSAFVERLAALGIPSLLGNHEDWLDDEGGLSIVRDSPHRRLTPAALAWCQALPLRLRVRLLAAPGLKVVAVHTCLAPGRRQRWPFLDRPEKVEQLILDEGADVVLTGHTHGPKVWRVPRDPDLGATATPLELEPGARLVVPLEPGVRWVLDAGSLGRPGHHPDPGRFDLATYAVLDVGRRQLELHALTKPG